MLQLVKQITAAGAVSKGVAMVDCAILIDQFHARFKECSGG